MKLHREWAMPNSKTFDILPIKNLIEYYLKTNNSIDPFANTGKLARVTNDINPGMNTDFNLPADKFLGMFDTSSIDFIFYDPPYSLRQMKEVYEGAGREFTENESQSSYLSICKKQCIRILKPNGICMSFGWNTNGIGSDSMQIEEILIVAHGGQHNDTLCTVERKLQGELF